MMGFWDVSAADFGLLFLITYTMLVLLFSNRKG